MESVRTERGHVERRKKGAKPLGIHRGEGRLHESSRATESFHEGLVGQRVGNVAVPATGHQQFQAGAFLLLKENDLRAAFRRGDRGHHSRGTRADDHYDVLPICHDGSVLIQEMAGGYNDGNCPGRIVLVQTFFS